MYNFEYLKITLGYLLWNNNIFIKIKIVSTYKKINISAISEWINSISQGSTTQLILFIYQYYEVWLQYKNLHLEHLFLTFKL